MFVVSFNVTANFFYSYLQVLFSASRETIYGYIYTHIYIYIRKLKRVGYTFH
jgi:hypothetical protein